MNCIRLAVGILGNATSLLLYSAPILTFGRVAKKRSTEEFSCVPYTVALLNCLLYTWYGLPVVSVKWENFPVVTINGVGILLETSFIIIYCMFTKPRTRRIVMLMLGVFLLIFAVTAFISSFALSEHGHKKMLVGSVGLVASVCMYASPLVVMKRVIQTKSVEFMPFYLSLFSFLASSLWMAYGLLGHDMFLAAPNLVGCPLGFMQLVLYCVYRSSKYEKSVSTQSRNLDTEKGSQLS